MSVRVVIADDQALVRSGFRVLLERERDITVVGEAANGSDAVAAARALAPDVILMDIRMPGVDGLVATAEVTALPPPAPRVIILTTFDLDEYVYEALRAGAAGFLLKDATAAELASAVRVVATGEALLAPSVTRRLIARFGHSGGAVAPTLDGLTEREHEVLRLVARGLSNAEIADALAIGEPTVKTHVSHVLAKLGLRNRVQAVAFAYERGLVRPEYEQT